QSQYWDWPLYASSLLDILQLFRVSDQANRANALRRWFNGYYQKRLPAVPEDHPWLVVNLGNLNHKAHWRKALCAHGKARHCVSAANGVHCCALGPAAAVHPECHILRQQLHQAVQFANFGGMQKLFKHLPVSLRRTLEGGPMCRQMLLSPAQQLAAS